MCCWCWQAHLDKDAVELAISNEVFAMLKRSNVHRFRLLTELLRRLGLNCDKPVSPSLTPICLLATSQVRSVSECFLTVLLVLSSENQSKYVQSLPLLVPSWVMEGWGKWMIYLQGSWKDEVSGWFTFKGHGRMRLVDDFSWLKSVL